MSDTRSLLPPPWWLPGAQFGTCRICEGRVYIERSANYPEHDLDVPDDHPVDCATWYLVWP